MAFGYRFWKQQTYYLDKMSLADLVKAYFTYPAIQVYILFCVLGIGLTVAWFESIWTVLLAVAVTPPIYALVWYVLHRYVLHGRFLYKSPQTANLWKRIHFDHHQDPHNLSVLFGALKTTLPPIFLMTVPAGYLIGGPSASAAAMAMGMFTTCVYEFCHCIQHLAYSPKLSIIKRMKKLHLAHHFHNEQGNYGITDFSWDRLFGTLYPSVDLKPRSPTVFNLGYDDGEAERFPWVAELTPQKK